MKKCFSILILSSILSVAFSQNSSLRAYLSHASFHAPGQGHFIETYLSLLGKSIAYVKKDNGKFQGNVLVTMLFLQNDSIKEFRKYDLHTTELDDTTNINFIVFDQQRIALPNGKYLFELELADKNLNLPAFKAKDSIFINFEKKKIEFSSIELVESFTPATESSPMAKSGFDFIPYQDFFYPQSVNKVMFYSEIYNTGMILGADNQFVVASEIQSFETGKTVNNYFRIKRETASEVNVVFNEFDITDLPSGNYNLVITVRDKNNQELASQMVFFQRSNPGIQFNTTTIASIDIKNTFVVNFTNPDTLREFIRMTFPIASGNEKLFIKYNVAKGDLLTMQQFMYDFWKQRNAVDPEGEWINYYNIVQGVEAEFGSTNKKGYETDRGRVYLQYGPPNQRVIEPYTASTLPYEIWQYYKYESQTNLRFVFYTPDRSINDYQLAHSTAIGEVKNVNWQYEIRGLTSPMDTDNSLYKRPYELDTFNEFSGEFFNDPR
jgi:GWxTD domain-containing protein